MNDYDIALDIIKKTYQLKERKISLNLVIEIYKIEKQFLFEKNRNLTLDKIKLLINKEIDIDANL